MVYFLFAVGLCALLLGGEWLVRGASAIARHFGLPPLVIGLTVVGFGTSAPELLVSIQAAFAGQPAIAIGNVLGSNIANVLLILGASALIWPMMMPANRPYRDIGFMLAAVAAMWVMLLDGRVSQIEGALLALALLAFLASAFLLEKDEPPEGLPKALPMWQALGITVAGLVLLVIGARLLVDSSTQIARTFGVSEAVIGLTIVAIGTSLPELATSIIAALRKQSDIAIGNVIGSNIFNIFGILGITAVITPIPVDPRFAGGDMIWVAGSAFVLACAALFLRQLPRAVGGALLAAYVAYLALI